MFGGRVPAILNRCGRSTRYVGSNIAKSIAVEGSATKPFNKNQKDQLSADNEKSKVTDHKRVYKMGKNYKRTPFTMPTRYGETNADHISKKIDISINGFNPYGVFEAFEFSRQRKITLKMKDYIGVLWACENIDISNNNLANITKCKHAYIVYNIFKKEKNIPTDVFIKMMKVCAKLGHGTTAVMVLRDFSFYGYKVSDLFTQDYVIAAARAAKTTVMSLNQDPLNNADLKTNFVSAVELYVKRSEKEKWSGSAEFYAETAMTFSMINDEKGVLDTLNRMTELEHEPSRSFCAELFGFSLLNGNTLVLFTLCNWYLDNFSDAMIEEGALIRLMHIASASGDVQLCRLGFQLYKQCGYRITAQEYVCLINAALVLRDFPTLLSAMQEAEAVGVDISNCPDVNITAVSEFMVKILSQSTKQLDDIYFGLVTSIRENQKVPPLALSILIRSSGRMGNIDRAFATFQECHSLFDLPKDIHIFNALLFAIAKSYNPMLLNVLTVFQNMESAQVSPSSESFSILFEVMAELGDMQGCEDLIQHMNALNLFASDRSFRRLCFKYAATHEPLGLMMILDIMREKYRKTFGTTTLVTQSPALHVGSFAAAAALPSAGVLDAEHVDDIFFTEEDDAAIFPLFFRKRVLFLMNNPVIPFSGKNHLPSFEERPLPSSARPSWPSNRLAQH